MERVTACLILATAGLLAISCATPAGDPGALDAKARTWIAGYNAGDAEAMVSIMGDGVIALPPNAGPIEGKEALLRIYERMLTAGLKAETRNLETEISGHLAYRRGEYRILTADSRTVDEGKYLEIWQRVAGEWLMIRDIWNTSLPPAPSESPAAPEDAQAGG